MCFSKSYQNVKNYVAIAVKSTAIQYTKRVHLIWMRIKSEWIKHIFHTARDFVFTISQMKLDWRYIRLTKLKSIKTPETILIWFPLLHIDSGQQLHKSVLQRQIFISWTSIWQPSSPLKVAQEYCVEFPTRIEENNWFYRKFKTYFLSILHDVLMRYSHWVTLDSHVLFATNSSLPK